MAKKLNAAKTLKQIQAKERQLSTQAQRMMTKRSFSLALDTDTTFELWKAVGLRLLQARGIRHFYEVDEMNEKEIRQLCMYLSNDIDFKGDLNKGIFFRGGVGTGKTLSCKVLKEMLSHANKVLNIVSAVEIAEAYINKDSDMIWRLDKGLLCIDDMGTEEAEINVYGTTRRPIYETICKRYDKNMLTFVTSNLTPNEIEERYGNRVRDRLKEMLNQIKFLGESRRK